jgi:hypothetical protein
MLAIELLAMLLHMPGRVPRIVVGMDEMVWGFSSSIAMACLMGRLELVFRAGLM